MTWLGSDLWLWWALGKLCGEWLPEGRHPYGGWETHGELGAVTGRDLCSCLMAAATDYPRLSGLDNTNVFSSGSAGERPDSRPHQAKQEQGFGCLSSVWRRESGGEPASSPSQLPGPPAFPTCGPSVFKAATCSLCALFCHHNSLSRPQRERFCL